MLKVGFEAISFFGHTGIESYARGLMRGFSHLDDDFEISLFTSFGRAKRYNKLFGVQKRLKYINYFPHPLILGRKFEPVSSGLRNNLLIKLAAMKVDLIHWVNPCYYYDVLDNSVVTIHDIFPFYKDDWAIDAYDIYKEEYCMRYELAFENAKLLFVPSYNVKDEILKNFPDVTADRICVTYEAAHEIYRQIKPDYLILKDYNIFHFTKYFLFVSRLDQRKNIEGLLMAISYLTKDIKKKFKFIIVGSGRKEEVKYFRRVIRMLDLDETIMHFENVPNEHLVHIYNAAYGFIFPSFSEGFGLPIIEAMQCGCPVITSDVSCMPEIAGEAALYIKPDDFHSISEGIAKLASDSQFRDELSFKGLEQAKLFSWEKCAEETLKGYKRALNIL